MLTLEELKNQIYEMGDKILVSKESNLMPMFSETKEVFNEGSSIYINDKYHYIIMEKGQINQHYESQEIDDILYPLFKDITSTLAQEYEVNNRIEKEDFRRVLWRKQLELLEKLDKKFRKIREKEIKDILKIAPYSD